MIFLSFCWPPESPNLVNLGNFIDIGLEISSFPYRLQSSVSRLAEAIEILACNEKATLDFIFHSTVNLPGCAG